MKPATTLFLCFLYVAYMAAAADEATNQRSNQKTTTYIIHMDQSHKPESFDDHEQWYGSLLKTVSQSADMLYTYNTLIHGYSVTLTPQEAESLSKQPGVLSVSLETVYQLHTTRSPLFLGLEQRSQQSLLPASASVSEVTVGVLDTGVWPELDSFNDKDLGPIPATWKGTCEVGKGFDSTKCNKKLIGARYFSKGYEAAYGPVDETIESKSPRDDDGHGSHTSTTAAGSVVSGASLFGFAAGTARGMAPQARVAVYKVCWLGGCFGSDILAAMEKAVEDGVNVISMSIGGGLSDYYRDTVSIGAFAAAAQGIFVSCSAGNGGPSQGSLSNVAPWITTVGAGTLDRFPSFFKSRQQSLCWHFKSQMICNISPPVHLKPCPSPIIQTYPRQPSAPTITLPHHYHTSLRFPTLSGRNLARNCSGSLQSTTDVSSTSPSSSSSDEGFDAELDRLLALLPEEMRARLLEHPELVGLVEVVLDLGRPPLARFPSGDFILSDSAITLQDLQFAASQVGDFAIDNRAGISRTLHRISAIRNRKGEIIGLTCRVGRAIQGSASLLRDLVQDGASILLIGPPGVGKTTIIREIARMLANDYQKRVMIVDTSNEIGGDGDIPHSGIGNARRMQVGNSEMQHKVLIEAVENHMPQVIVIDEIGTKLEAMAASTIAQRGIQLVATAHGVTIENLIMNPSLDMLIGGIQSVTLGDDEASRRGVQKTVLERKGPSTFGCGVEIISKTELRVHRYLESTVDAVLAGRSPVIDVRKMRLQVSNGTTEVEPYADTSVRKEQDNSHGGYELMDERLSVGEFTIELPLSTSDLSSDVQPFRLYVYGILEASVIQVINQLEVAVQLTYNISEADGLLALQSKIKKNLKIQAAAESHKIPIYVTKTSSLVQVTKAIKALINDHDADGSNTDGKSSEKMDALEETRIAIEEVVIPKGEPVELLPRQYHIITLQMNFIQGYKLQSEILGRGPEARLRILPYTAQKDNTKSNIDKESGNTDDDADDGEDDDAENLSAANGGTNGSIYTVEKLPFLPDSF